MSKKCPAVFLDRDGVIAESRVRDGKPYAVNDPNDVRIIPGASEAVAKLKKSGYLVVVVTNQPDVGNQLSSSEDVDMVNRILQESIDFDAIYVCYHTDSDECLCRKPKPGMLLQAALDLGIDLETSIMVGDRWRDINAGNAAGCSTIFIDLGYSERLKVAPNLTVRDLGEATQRILEI